MGKDWLYWGGGSINSNSNNTSTKSGGGSRSKKGRLGEVNHSSQASSGCMSAVFQLFDFHHFQFPLHHQHQVPSFHPPHSSQLPDKPIRGVEAPRNSLEMEEEPYTTSFPSSTMKGQESFLIPMGIQVKTRTDDLSSEFSSSPGSKTPNLVARLMGLDILPPPADTCSTSSSSSTCVPASKSSHPHMMRQIRSSSVRSRNLFDTDIIGTRSLPETPRISSARRSDVEYHHRLSLQINKENAGVTDDLSTRVVRRSDQILRREDHDHQSISPSGRYARQIVKQVKEKVSRRVAGLDITNSIRSNREIKGRRDDDYGDHDHVVLLTVKKSSKGCERVENEFSISPRLKKQNQMPLSASINANAQPVRVPVKQKSQSAVSPIPLHDSDQKHKKIIGASHDQSPLKKQGTISNAYRNIKQEEPFVRSSSVTNRANLLEKKSKKTPLSSELLLNTNVVPTLFPVKKDYPSSSSAAKFPQKTAHGSEAISSSKRTPLLSSNTSQVTYFKQEANKQTPTVKDLITRYNNSAGDGGAAFHYITRILKRTGIDKNTPLSFTQWYSASHPLNPCIFDHLEISFPIPNTTVAVTTTSIDSLLHYGYNRKLVFQLVDEILFEISKPFYVNFKRWGSSNRSVLGSELTEKICTKIESFPSADCQVLEDIDSLIENDLGESGVKGSMAALEEEGEAIVEEIEKEIVESLVHEMAVGAKWGTRADVGHVGTRDGILFQRYT